MSYPVLLSAYFFLYFADVFEFWGCYLKKILQLLLLLLLATGCVSFEQVTSLKTDKSGKMYIHYWVRWQGAQDTILYNKTPLFTEDSLRQELNRGYIEVNNIDVYKHYIDSTLHSHVEFRFTNIDSLNNGQAFKDFNFQVKPGPGGIETFSQYIPPYSMGFGFSGDSVTISYVYYLPGKIINHNASEMEANKLTWRFTPADISKGVVINATYIPFKLKETPVWIYIFGMVVILVVFVFLFRKK